MPALRSTRDLGLAPDREGKVRDVFDLGIELLVVATDRVSAFDVVMNDLVPGRGVVLNVMSLGWFKHFAAVVPNHVVTADPTRFPAPFAAHADMLGGRSMLVRKAERFPVECVVRGYLAGSGFKSYRKSGAICGQALPAGLELADRLPEPLFTPTTKADEGHDLDLTYAEVETSIGVDAARALRDLTLRLYGDGADHARARGVILADTKFEFGLIDGRIHLIDEVMTPDSSRFWPANEVVPGREPPSWDKQILRNHLETLTWDKAPPPPALPPGVLARTAQRYREVLEILFPEEATAWRAYL